MSAIINASIIVFVSVVILMGIVPTFLIPWLYGSYFNGALSKGWFAQFIGVPAEVVSWPNVLWYTAFPLMATIAIVYGFFEEFGMFRHALNNELIYAVIAIGWSLLLIRTGVLGSLSRFMYAVGALVAIIIFVIVFVIGAIMLGVGKVRERF